jgi:hypothetical protein
VTKNNVVTDDFDRLHRRHFVTQALKNEGMYRQRARWLWAQRAKGRDIGQELNRLFDRVGEHLAS